MMSTNMLTIFHVYRKDGTSIFLYPFSEKKNLVEILERSDITGLYGKEPRVESLTMLRNELYRMIERSVREWTAERRFIPRFLLSAAVFLLLYFVMSVVIRDPIPMVDELIIGLVGSLIFYGFLTRRAADSKTATAMKIKLRTKIDEIVFNEDPFVKDAEDYLQNCEGTADPAELLENIINSGEKKLFSNADGLRVEQFLDCISLRYDEKEIRRNGKLLSRMTENRDDQVELKKILKWMSHRKVDPFLFAVYARINREKSIQQ